MDWVDPVRDQGAATVRAHASHKGQPTPRVGIIQYVLAWNLEGDAAFLVDPCVGGPGEQAFRIEPCPEVLMYLQVRTGLERQRQAIVEVDDAAAVRVGRSQLGNMLLRGTFRHWLAAPLFFGRAKPKARDTCRPTMRAGTASARIGRLAFQAPEMPAAPNSDP